MRHIKQSRRGSTVVETSLILVVFLTLTVAVVDAAQFLLLHQNLMEQARAAGRRAAVENLNEGQVQNIVLSGSTASPPADAPGQFGLTRSNVTVTFLDQCLEEQRVVIRIRNMQLRMMTPLVGRALNMVPVEVSVPIERVIQCPPAT